ncbi:tail fiber protein, partial [Candidatus Wolfebacteria bacterium]|nr:tail fiber protein [Candidatus Wolfebacteria bacterium]
SNVGIGTTGPLSKLDINGGVAIGAYAGNNAAPSNGLIVSGNVGIGTNAPAYALTVAGTSYHSTSSFFMGNVGIGTTTSTAKLGVNGIIESTTGGFKFPDGTIQTVAAGDPAGTIKMYGGSVAPSGYLFCDGSAISRTTYAALFTILSTIYGAGDGSTTFNVPDLRGRIPVGVGTGVGGGTSGTGLPAGGSALTTVVRGTWKGEETHVLTSSEMPSHTHSFPAGYDSGTSYVVPGGILPITTQNTSAAGGGAAHNIIQPVMGVNFIIKY